jgi:short-subunit dehydrogenase
LSIKLLGITLIGDRLWALGFRECDNYESRYMKRSIKDWRDKTVIVTGAGTGVGKAMCHELASRGAIVYVTARSMDKCRPVADEIIAKGFKAIPEKLEVGNDDEFKHVVELVKEKHGKLDVLINNAAIVFVGEFYDMTEEQIHKLVHINLSGLLTGTLNAYRVMKQQGSGTIVNISSMGGYLPATSMAAYSATKHALIGLTRSLGAEATDLGVHIRAMSLGLVKSEMLNKAETKHGDGNIVYETVPIRPMDTEKAAKKLINGLAGNSMWIFVPWYAKLYWHIQRFLPGLVFKGAVATMRKYREAVKKVDG